MPFGMTTVEGIDPIAMNEMAGYMTPQYAARPGFSNPGDSDPGLMQGQQYMSNAAAGMRAQEQQMLQDEMMAEYWERAAEREQAALQRQWDREAADDEAFARLWAPDGPIYGGVEDVAEAPENPVGVPVSDGRSPASTHPLTEEGQSLMRSRQNTDRPRADNATNNASSPPPSGSWLADFLGSLPSHATVNTREMPNTETDYLGLPPVERIGSYNKPSPRNQSYGQGSYGR